MEFGKNQLQTSSELASVMEFGFIRALYALRRVWSIKCGFTWRWHRCLCVFYRVSVRTTTLIIVSGSSVVERLKPSDTLQCLRPLSCIAFVTCSWQFYYVLTLLDLSNVYWLRSAFSNILQPHCYFSVQCPDFSCQVIDAVDIRIRQRL